MVDSIAPLIWATSGSCMSESELRFSCLYAGPRLRPYARALRENRSRFETISFRFRS